MRSSESNSSNPTTPADLFRQADRAAMDAHWYVRYPVVFLESFVLGGLAIVVASTIAGAEIGFYALFLMAASLNGRFRTVIEENREGIWARQESPWVANGRTFATVLAMFMGLWGAIWGLAWNMPVHAAHEIFGFVSVHEGVGERTLLAEGIGAFAVLKAHVGALVGFFILCTIYRNFGATLVLAFSACTWVIESIEAFELSGATSAIHEWTVLLLVAPDAMLEASAYTLAALGGIFLSLAVERYPPGDPRLRRVAVASGTYVVVAAFVATVGVGVEVWLTPMALALVAP